MVNELREIIIKDFDNLIGSKVILLDCPYHGNIGDLLIWQGECDFFKRTNRKVIEEASSYTFDFPAISSDITICLHGGGNFGDLYREAQDFRIKVIEAYPHNEIVIFPQSVYYEDEDLIKADVEKFSKHNRLTICARDRASYEFLIRNFRECSIKLVPDMAFCIDLKPFLSKENDHTGSNQVLIKRLDKEIVEEALSDLTFLNQRDWPTFETKYHWTTVIIGLGKRSMKIPNSFLKKKLAKVFDYVMQKKLKFKIIKLGVKMLNQYDVIYTTRLHAMILGILLGKKIFIIDNLTKKLTEFYYTWLKNNEEVQIYSQK